jgi:FkbM family methyltransferase
VDVGAGDPLLDSVTAGLYRRGWHGINIEPGLKNFRKLERSRKRDLNLRVAAGEKDGMAKFVFTRNPHESSADSLMVGDLIEEAGSWSESVHVETLDSILKAWPSGNNVDLIKIDVEGYEVNVIKGLNLLHWKPRLLLVELVNGRVDNSKAIQDLLAEFGYLQAHFDSLNGFFVKAQDLEYASSIFRFGVNYKDNFMRFQHHRLWVWTLGPLRRSVLNLLRKFIDVAREEPRRRPSGK